MRKEEIINSLNENQSTCVQNKAIELALKETDKSFLLPYAENIEYAENCAKIFVSLTDVEIENYLEELISWVEDLNTPGAIKIFERLMKCSGKILYYSYKQAIYRSKKRKTKSFYNNLLLIFKGNKDLQNFMEINDFGLYQCLVISK